MTGRPEDVAQPTASSAPAPAPGEGLAVVYRPLAELLPYARNARTHTDAQVSEIAGSIKAFGFTNPVLVRRDGVIIAGHGRVRAARLLGMTMVPTIELANMTETQARALTLADNRIALNAGWDHELLALELKDLRDLGATLDGLGFTDRELKAALVLPGHESAEDAGPAPTIRDCDIRLGDALEVLRKLGDGTVRCCVTSPPYWGLRDYGQAGQYGLEPTLDQYVARMVEVFGEVRRVLTRDGTLWLNLGDSYIAGRKGTGGPTDKQLSNAGAHYEARRYAVPDGCKAKDLAGVPWRVAVALREAGWWLRADIIWAKPGPMPESVEDRPTKAHEYVFLLAKSERYFYDQAAVVEPSLTRAGVNPGGSLGRPGGDPFIAGQAHRGEPYMTDGTRNRRSVWTIPQAAVPDAHFAVMPRALAEVCVLAGSERGDTVLDPFTGAGTTALVALQHRRRFVGAELNPEYRRLALRRIKRHLEGLADLEEEATEAEATEES